jgi:hypothetical protein
MMQWYYELIINTFVRTGFLAVRKKIFGDFNVCITSPYDQSVDVNVYISRGSSHLKRINAYYIMVRFIKVIE